VGHPHATATTTTPGCPMKGKLVLSFLSQSLVATAGALVAGILLTFIVALPFGWLSSGMGNIVDRTVDTWIVRYLSEEPYFVFPVVTAACLGFLSYKFTKSRVASWVWVIPTAILLVNVVPRILGSSAVPKWVFDNYFGRGCGASECLYELVVTGPFYTSVAYALCACVARRHFRTRTVRGLGADPPLS
jgi:hypothetical protein